MKRKLIFAVLVALIVGTLGYILVNLSSSEKLFTKKVFIGYNQTFPINNDKFVIYSGHNFVNFSPSSNEIKIVSPDTGAKLEKISVSSDGASAVAYVSYADPSDTLVTQYSVQNNSWVQFDFSNNNIKPFNIDSDFVFALNSHKLAALITEEPSGVEDNATPAESRFVIISASGTEKYAAYSESPTQVRESNDSLIVASGGAARTAIYKVGKNSSDFLAYTSTRSTVSLDGSYFYSVESEKGKSGLIDRESSLKIFSTRTGKVESTTKLPAGASVFWGSNNRIALSNTNNNSVKVISYPGKKEKDYTVKDGLGGVCAPTNNGVLVITGGGIGLATNVAASDSLSIESIKEVDSDTSYSVHKTGNKILVSMHGSGVPEVITNIKTAAGDSYPRIGFVFGYPEVSNLDTDQFDVF